MIKPMDVKLPDKCPYCGSGYLIEEGGLHQPSCDLLPNRIICGDCGKTVWTKEAPPSAVKIDSPFPSVSKKLVNALVCEATVTAADKPPKTVKKTVPAGDGEWDLSHEEYPLCLLGTMTVSGNTLTVCGQSYPLDEGCFLTLTGKHATVYRDMVEETITARVYQTYQI